jgi:hypothetical protein
MSEFFPIPILYAGIPAYLMQKNAVGGSKNIPPTAEGIIRRIHCKPSLIYKFPQKL